MPALVACQTVFERLARDPLHAGVHGRVHLDAPLQQVVDAEVGVEAGEFAEDVFDHGGRLERP